MCQQQLRSIEMLSWAVTPQHGGDRLERLRGLGASYHAPFPRAGLRLFSNDSFAVRKGYASWSAPRATVRRFKTTRKIFFDSVVCFAVVFSLYACMCFCAEESESTRDALPTSRFRLEPASPRDAQNPPPRKEPADLGAMSPRLVALMNSPTLSEEEEDSVYDKIRKQVALSRPRGTPFMSVPPKLAIGSISSSVFQDDWEGGRFRPGMVRPTISSRDIATQSTPVGSGSPTGLRLGSARPFSTAHHGATERRRPSSYPGAESSSKTQDPAASRSGPAEW